MDVGGSQVSDYASNSHTGIDACERSLGCNGFGEGCSGVGFIEQPLALKVAGLDIIAVDDSEAPDAGAHQSFRLETPEGAAADDCDVRGEKFLLPLFADAGE